MPHCKPEVFLLDGLWRAPHKPAMTFHKEHRIGGAGKRRKQLRRLGVMVRQARIAFGFSQAQLALKVGCSQQTIGNIETGVHWPSIPVAFALRERLCISLDEVCPLKAPVRTKQ